MRQRALLVLLSLCILAPAVPAFATQVVHRTPEELGRSAELVVRGRVDDVRSFWNADRTRILTEVTVSVVSQHKGAPVGTVRVLQMGGVVDGVRMTVAGALSWTANEDVLLFLEPSLDRRYRVAGFNQGKYRIQRDPRTGVEFVQQAPLGGTELVGGPAAGSPSARADGRVELGSFLQRVRPSMEGGR